MCIRTILFGLTVWCLIVVNTIRGDEMQKPVPASLDEAATFEEIRAYIENAFKESQKDLKTMEDHERFLETYPPIGIAGGRKIIALGGDDKSLEYGYGILTAALNWSFKNHPENVKEYESVAEEIKNTGKFPELVDSTRFYLFYNQWRTFTKKISTSEFSKIKNEFDAMKEEAKELTALKQTRHSSDGPMEIVLDLAREISVVNDNPCFLDDVLEELVAFVNSDNFEKKKINEDFLRGYCRRMTGSPFELWGKTIDGNDFNWADYKGKFVLIVFTASWCGPCRAEMPSVVEMYNKYHDNGLEVVCIGYNDKTDNLEKMIEENKIVFPMIPEELTKDDSRGLPSVHYGVNGIPEIFLIGKDGRIIATGNSAKDVKHLL